MDCDNIKILLLTNLLNIHIPKIFGYYKIMHGDSYKEHNFSWSPNVYYLNENFRDLEFKFYHNTDLNSGKTETRLQKNENTYTIQQLVRYRMRAGVEGVEDRVQEEQEIFTYQNKTKAIKEISKKVKIDFIIKICKIASLEIESFENPNNLSIGTIKELLNISPNVNLEDLAIRDVLTEKI